MRPQVDLEAPKKVTGIITQGAKDFGSVQFVTAFKVAHSDDGQSWTTVKDETTRTDKVRANMCRVTPGTCDVTGSDESLRIKPGDVIESSMWNSWVHVHCLSDYY